MFADETDGSLGLHAHTSDGGHQDSLFVPRGEWQPKLIGILKRNRDTTDSGCGSNGVGQLDLSLNTDFGTGGVAIGSGRGTRVKGGGRRRKLRERGIEL